MEKFKLIANIGDIQSINSESITDSKVKKLYNNLLELFNLDEVNYRRSEKAGFIDQAILEYNSRIEFLNLNEKYNQDFQNYINDSISHTENQINEYNRKRDKYGITPSRFIVNLTLTDKDKLIGSEHFHSWIRALIIRSKRLNVNKEILMNQLCNFLGKDKFLKIENDIEKEFSTITDNKSDNTIYSKLSLYFDNSKRIDFEKLFPKAGATNRALYQTLLTIAETEGTKSIIYESYKTIALKCRTKIEPKTVKSNLIKESEKGLIQVEIKNKSENEKVKNDLELLLKNKEITLDEYVKRLKKELKPEFLERIDILDNKEFVSLANPIQTNFFKSELCNVKALGTRGNELFWTFYEKKELSQKEIYNLYPSLKNKTDVLRENINYLLEFEFLTLIGKKNYSVNTHDFLLKIERAKEADIAEAEKRNQLTNSIFETAKQKLIEKGGDINNPILNSFDESNVKNLIHRHKKLLQFIGKKWKNGASKEEIKKKSKMSSIDLLISQLTTVTILIYENGQYKLNKELYDFHTKKQRKTKIPHQTGFNHFLEKQVKQYENERARRERFLKKDEIQIGLASVSEYDESNLKVMSN